MTLAALLLGWLVPGAGHLLLSRTRRAIIIFVTLTATFWSGMAIGGVTTIDPRAERWWFIAQMLNGISGVGAWHMQNQLHAEIEPLARKAAIKDAAATGQRGSVGLQPYIDRELAEDGLGLGPPGDTVARAYSGVAGLLNLLCIFDVVMLSMIGVRGEGPIRQGAGKDQQ